MAQVLVIAEHRDGKLSASTAKTLTCALQVPDATTSIAVFSDNGGQVAAQAARLSGVRRVLRIDDARHAHPLAALIAPQVAEIAAEYSHVFGPSTTFGRDLMPRVAALLGAPQVSDLAAVEGVKRFRRPAYAGNATLTVEVDAAIIVATVRIASFQPALSGEVSVDIEVLQPRVELPTHTRHVSLVGAISERPDLQSATRVISGGRAFATEDGFKRLYKLADLLGAAVGASRAAVDSGIAPSELQVGQTGKIISPELYMAFGISGAIQHLTGIKDARTIVAVNRDSEAPIFEVADVGLVADVYTTLSELEQLLSARQA